MQDFENLSDEEMLNMEAPAPIQESHEEVPVETNQEEEEPLFVDSDNTTYEDRIDEEAATAPATEEDVSEPKEETQEEPAAQETSESDTTENVVTDDDHTTPQQTAPDTTSDDTKEETKEVTETAVNYEEEYKKIMAPFKANGREISLDNPEDVIKMMQQGANYTKKMQALAPNLKLMKMLDNNSLLDEGNINFLIDLSNKDPKAIQKLLHDSSIDPLDLDTSADPAYQPGNHSVSDEEMQFHDVLGDLKSTPEGQATISVVNTDWDQASREAVYREPQILKVITEQRANGIYDQISAEMEKRRVLGTLGNATFLQAYKEVGDSLHAEGKFDSVHQAPTSEPAEVVLETRAAKPKPSAPNGDKAKAASPASNAPKPAVKAFDPFNMTDEEIMAVNTTRV